MTGTVNGIGTHLSGERNLTNEEIKEWSKHFPYNPHRSPKEYKIATESFVLLWIPLIPLKTFVFYYANQGLMDSQYVPIFFPAGKDKVYWNHVKKSWSFYIAPILIALWVLFFMIIPAISGVVGDIQTNLQERQAMKEQIIPENTQNSSSSINTNKEETIFSASEIYENSKDSMFIVETECDLKITYPSFKVKHTYDTYSEELDIEIQKLNQKEIIEDSVVWSGSGFLINNKVYTNNHVIDCGTEELKEYLQLVYLSLVDYYNQGYLLDETYLEEIEFDIDSKSDEIFDYVYDRSEYYYYERDVIETFLVARIAEYLSENIEVSSTGRKIYAYHESDNFQNPNKLIIDLSGGNFPERDFSILSLDTIEKSLDYKEDYQVKIGEEIYVLGFPLIEVDSPETEEEYYEWEIKKEPPIITKGIISSLKESRNGVKYYVIDAVANYGSSGGPVINNKGKVIGILTAGVEGLNFMLPLSEITIE